jgi:hypothetical protein
MSSADYSTAIRERKTSERTGSVFADAADYVTYFPQVLI